MEFELRARVDSRSVFANNEIVARISVNINAARARHAYCIVAVGAVSYAVIGAVGNIFSVVGAAEIIKIVGSVD